MGLFMLMRKNSLQHGVFIQIAAFSLTKCIIYVILYLYKITKGSFSLIGGVI